MPKGVTCFGTVTMYAPDVASVLPTQWLRTNALAYVFAQQQQRLPASEIFYVDPSSVQCMANFGDAAVGPVADIVAARHSVFAVNDYSDPERLEAGQHWSLLCASVAEPDDAGVCHVTFRHLDSAGRANAVHAEALAKLLCSGVYTSEVFKVHGKPASIVRCGTVDRDESFPQQHNSFDCGVFVCCAVERVHDVLARSAAWDFDQDTVAAKRTTLFAELSAVVPV